jgi:hypothetical protein
VGAARRSAGGALAVPARPDASGLSYDKTRDGLARTDIGRT